MELQLDILFCQAQALSASTSPGYVNVETYDPKKGVLVVSYWNKGSQIKIERGRSHLCAGLKVHHLPYNKRLPVFERFDYYF
jgi:hypothetical protein